MSITFSNSKAVSQLNNKLSENVRNRTAIIPQSPDLIFGNQLDVITTAVDTTGLIAGIIDWLGLEGYVNTFMGKIGSHVKANSGQILKSLVLQLLSVPYQTLYGTAEFFQNRPIDALLGTNIVPEDLNRHVLGRFLDDVYDADCEKLYVLCANLITERLGLSPTEVHIDTTSFHYDGQAKNGDEGSINIDYGYSRDHRPDLPQILVLLLADGQSKLPIYQRTISGNVNDNKSFFDTVAQAWPLIIEQFKDLSYLVGDSALCTSSIFDEAANKGIKIVTRVPDKLKITKECFAKAEQESMTPVFEDQEDSPLGLWCGFTKIGEQDVKLLLIDNTKLKAQKEATIRRRAQKELENVQDKLKKLQTQPKKCQKDAEAEVNKLVKKCKYCVISEITYEDVIKQARRGRPRKDGINEQQLEAVKVKANVSLNEEAIKQTLKNETKYVIATNDLERDFTMAELLSIYKRQSVIERKWRILKDPTLMVNAIYLKTPRRIEALMWVLSIALLIFSACEYMVRKTMKDNELTIPDPEHKKQQNQPTLNRLFKYMENCHLSLVYVSATKTLHLSGLTPELMKLFLNLGPDVTKYYTPSNYKSFIERVYGVIL